MDDLIAKGYTPLWYIESDGTQYIDTGFKPTLKTKLYADFEIITTGNDQGIMGVVDDNCCLVYNQTNIYGSFKAGTGESVTVNASSTYYNRHTASIENGVFTLDNVEHTFTQLSSYSSGQNVYIFALNYNGAYGATGLRMYAAKIYDNGTLVRDLVPAKNNEGVCGLYDKVNDVFYASATDSGFKEGIPADYKLCKWIQCDGSQYIDTGFVPNQDTKVVLDFMCTKAGDNNFFGARASTSSKAFTISTITSSGKTYWRLGYNNSSAASSVLSDVNVRHKFEHFDAALGIDGISVDSRTPATFTCPCTATIGYIQSTSNKYAGYGRIYSCQIYDNGTLVRDYVPVMNPNGLYGLYDRANNLFYSSATDSGFIGIGEDDDMSVLGYTKCEYIESDGTNYIDTGFAPNQDTRVIMDIDCKVDSGSTSKYIFGTDAGSSSNSAFSLSTYVSAYQSYYNKSGAQSFTNNGVSRMLVDKNKQDTYCNNILVASSTYSSFQSSYSAYIFCSNRAGTPYNMSSFKLYSCQIYDNGSLVRDYIPCQTNDGIYGLWDNVNKDFYPSSTSIGFTGKWAENKTLDVSLAEFRHRLMNSIKIESGLPVGTIFNFDYTGTVQEVTLPKGYYKLECWGAQGGDAELPSISYDVGSKGGYSVGVLKLESDTTLYIFVGGKGPNAEISSITYYNGGWNGGGGGIYQSIYVAATPAVLQSGAASGGGATDIALVTSSMSYDNYRTQRSSASLLSRIIVAGGGAGGAQFWDSSDSDACSSLGGICQGGGVEGRFVYGGTQSGSYNSSAGFGYGGNAQLSVSPKGGAGGGGWYGGVSKNVNRYASLAAGGGSGFVNIASNAQYRPSGYTGLELLSGETIAGNVSFPSPSGGTETGHSGNGYARITVVEKP